MSFKDWHLHRDEIDERFSPMIIKDEVYWHLEGAGVWSNILEAMTIENNSEEEECEGISERLLELMMTIYAFSTELDLGEYYNAAEADRAKAEALKLNDVLKWEVQTYQAGLEKIRIEHEKIEMEHKKIQMEQTRKADEIRERFRKERPKRIAVNTAVLLFLYAFSLPFISHSINPSDWLLSFESHLLALLWLGENGAMLAIILGSAALGIFFYEFLMRIFNKSRNEFIDLGCRAGGFLAFLLSVVILFNGVKGTFGVDIIKDLAQPVAESE